MVSSQGDRAAYHSEPMVGPSRSSRSRNELLSDIDTEQAFRLIDSILPFEACLYHQILPLKLEGSRLRLGMVNLDDTAALDYVRRILAYMNCSLMPQPLSSDAHHAGLSAYLSYTGSQKKAQPAPRWEKRSQPPVVDRHAEIAAKEIPSASVNVQPGVTEPAAKVAPATAVQRPDPNSQATLLLDLTEEVELGEQHLVEEEAVQSLLQTEVAKSEPPVVVADSPKASEAPTVEEVIILAGPAEAVAVVAAPPPEETEAERVVALELPENGLAVANGQVAQLELAQSELAQSELAQPQLTQEPTSDTIIQKELPALKPLPEGAALPALELEAHHLSSPPEVLLTLPPSALLQELLARVLVGGIGRLYFEQQQETGRVLWSQNGVLQSVLERLPLPLFQGLIRELKLLTHLPLEPVQKPQQVELERRYQHTRLLVRLRVMPGRCGEDATLQVLRGAALKFYQQQQLANLSRDALNMAQELQKKVNEIRQRTRPDLPLAPDHHNLLPTLNQVVRDVEQQLEHLCMLATTAAQDNPPPQ